MLKIFFDQPTQKISYSIKYEESTINLWKFLFLKLKKNILNDFFSN